MSTIGQSDQHLADEAFDPTAMLERIGGDMRLFAELVEMFLEDSPPLVDQVRQAITNNDAHRFKQAVHTLRGAIGNFTVGGPYELAKRLEPMAQIDNLRDARALFDSLAVGVDQLACALKLRVSCSDSSHYEGR